MFRLWFVLALSLLAGSTRALTLVLDPSSPQQREVYEELAARFGKLRPDIKLQAYVIEPESYKKQMVESLGSSQPMGDMLFWFAGEKLRYLVRQGWITSLDDLWRSEGLNEQFSEASRQLVSLDGRVYALPLNYYQWGFYYSRGVFQKLGLTPPRDWVSFLSVIQKLREANLIPVTLGSEAPWTLAAWFDYLNLRLNGIEFHQRLLRGEERFTDERVRRVFAYWKLLLEKKTFYEQHAGLGWKDAMPFLYRRKAGMVLMGNFFVASIPEPVKNDIGFFPFPEIEKDIPRYEEAPMDVALIPENSKNKDEAKAFLAFLAQSENQAFMNQRLAKSSPNLNAPAGEGFFLEEGKALLDSAAGITQFFDRDSDPRLAEAGLKAFADFMAHPDQLEAILATLEQARVRIYP